MKITSQIYCVGDNIDTDVIIPAQYLGINNLDKLGEFALSGIDNNFFSQVKSGKTILVAGKNFGCGSSREQAPISLKASGIEAIIATSFARIFYRNAINNGIPLLEFDLTGMVKSGDTLSVDFEKGKINHKESNKAWNVSPLPKFFLDIIRAGGLIAYTKTNK